MNHIKNKWSLITGASSGLGVDFAHLLAEQGSHLILTARRQDRLKKLKLEIEKKYLVNCVVIPLDLSVPQNVERLCETIEEKNIEVEILINNAGFGIYGNFTDVDWSKTQEMINLNIIALTRLTKVFSESMKKRKSGYILLVASMGGYQACPLYAAYGATKSYVLHFGEALSYELKDLGVKVSVLCPGITATEFLDVAGQTPSFYQKILMMRSKTVANLGLKSMFKGRPSFISGLINKIAIFSNRLAPRWLQAKIAHHVMKE